MPLLFESADKGTPAAMVMLGKIYYNGWAGETDKEKAFNWWKEGWRYGHYDAYKILAALSGLSNNELMAMIQQSANSGNDEACMMVGLLYELGKAPAPKEDLQTALQYYAPLVDKNNTVAMRCMGDIYILENSNNPDYSKGIPLYELAAAGGNSIAMMRLYSCYRYMRNDTPTALKWLRKAASLGDEEAIEELKKIGNQ